MCLEKKENDVSLLVSKELNCTMDNWENWE